MYSIKRFISRILFPRKTKFIDNFENALLDAVGETLQFDSSVQDLSSRWIAALPYAYVKELFIFAKEGWTIPFVHLFNRSNMVDAQSCYCLTQGFFLRILLEFIRKHKNYRIYSQEIICHNIRSNMRFGSTILSFSDYFYKVTDNIGLDNMLFWDYLPMCYVEKLLKTQCKDETILESLLSSIWADGEAWFGINILTTETIKQTMKFDSNDSNALPKSHQKETGTAREENEKKSDVIEAISKVLYEAGIEHNYDPILKYPNTIRAYYRISIKKKKLFSYFIVKNNYM